MELALVFRGAAAEFVVGVEGFARLLVAG